MGDARHKGSRLRVGQRFLRLINLPPISTKIRFKNPGAGKRLIVLVNRVISEELRVFFENYQGD